MRKCHLFILSLLALSIAFDVFAQEVVPRPSSERFPNIRSSLADGFYMLAEQQVLGVLQGKLSEKEGHEALLLLAHALWGQKRFSEMITRLESRTGDPGMAYWYARAHYELHQFNQAIEALKPIVERESRYASFALRLKANAEKQAGLLNAAESSCRQFSERFPDADGKIENLFDLADIYVLQDRIPEAVSIYDILISESDKQVSQMGRLKLAHLLYKQDFDNNAEIARNLFVDLATNVQTHLTFRIDAYVDLAALEEQSGNSDEAFEALRKAIELSPDALHRVPLKLSLVQMLLRADNTVEALKLLEQCRAEAPNKSIAAELQLAKAEALLQTKRYKDAADAFQVYLDVSDDLGGLSKAYLGRGLALWEEQRFAEAAILFDKASKGLSVPEEIATALFKSADAYYQSGKYEEAEDRYSQFATEFPSHENTPNALYQMGLSLAGKGQRSEAMDVFNTLEKKFPQSPFAEKAAFRLADLLRLNRQWEDALAKFAWIGETYSNSTVEALSLYQQGVVLYKLGRFKEAQKFFEQILDKHSSSEYAAQATYLRGFSLYPQGQTVEAIETCQKFIDRYPESEWAPEVMFWLAERYFNQGYYEAAEPLFVRIAEEFKNHRLAPRALYWAGRCSSKQSEYVVAVERYSDVARNYADSDILAQVRFAQGDALTELGEFSRAILAFDEVIKNYPDNPLVNAAWGRKGDCQFSLASERTSRYIKAISCYQAILDRPSAPISLKLQAEYKIGRCLEKTDDAVGAFARYMNVIYSFINENVERSPYSVMWFTRSAFGAATLKEREQSWPEAVKIYQRVVEAGVPARDEAAERIKRIKQDNWLLFQQVEEMDHVGADG